jgi:phospholipase/carboxylesterase
MVWYGRVWRENGSEIYPNIIMHYLSYIPDAITPDTKCIIMLHGVWSNEWDLFSLHEQFGEDSIVYSLQWPFSLGMGRYAWYPVDFSTGKALYQSDDVEKWYHEICDCIDEVQKKYSLDNENIFLMGFSQGAIMSYYTLWKSPEKIGGIIALSGRILDEIELQSVDTSQYQGKKVFVGHGTLDQVILFSATEKVEKYLWSLGLMWAIHSYPIAHSIVHTEIQDIVEWINL